MADKISEAEVRAILSRNLKRLRAKHNLSQLSLALKAELTHNFINDIENGKKWLSPRTLATLATALDTELHELFAPETTLSGEDATALTGYLDSFTGDVLQWAEDIKDRYLHKTEDND